MEQAFPTKSESQDLQSHTAAPQPIPTSTLAAPQPVAVNIALDSQKRKRRSVGPAPESEVARKRAKQENGVESTGKNIPESEDDEAVALVTFGENKEVLTETGGSLTLAPETSEGVNEHKQAAILQQHSLGNFRDLEAPKLAHINERLPEDDDLHFRSMQHDMGDRDVEPSVHPATTALYIKNFMRPLRPSAVRDHLLDLAAAAGKSADLTTITEFYLDPIRTHAFVVFTTVSAAARVRNSLHGTVWPNESNRKQLWVDFIPPQRVACWIDMEDSQSGGRNSGRVRWEVVYDQDSEGNVVAELDSGRRASASGAPASGAPAAPPGGPRGAMASSANNIPLGPRAHRGLEGAPAGPRRDSVGWKAPPVVSRPSVPLGPPRTTKTSPPIHFQMVADDLAQRRMRNMISYYSKDIRRDFGKEINRYTFESGEQFVDRGKEIWEGIRPPYREAEVQERRRKAAADITDNRRPDLGPPPHRRRYDGGGRHSRPRSPYRPRSDRYLPKRGGDRDQDRDQNRDRDRDLGRGRNDRNRRYHDKGDRRSGRDSYRDYRDRR